MKNSLHFSKNNKGAALVSIMIAITFISIIASTLLLISFNNYKMKVVNSTSKENFYEVEQDINVLTAKVRTMVDTTNTDNLETKIRSELGGSNTATTYTAEKIKNLLYPSETLFHTTDGYYVEIDNPLPDSSGNVTKDKFFIKSGGAIDKIDRTGGYEIVLRDIEIKQVNAQGYESKIKTDIHFFAQKGSSGGVAGGIGECSFLLDNGVEVDAIDQYNASGSTGTHVDIYGNCILGKYTLVNESFSTTTLSPNKNGTQHSTGTYLTKNGNSISTSNTEKQKAVILLHDCAVLNVLSDNCVIVGDIYLDGKSVMYVCNENCNFTVIGNIYVAQSAAFMCSGNIKFKDGCGIYKVNNSGGLTSITSSNPSQNIIIKKGIGTLEVKEYEGLFDKLCLWDNNADNDGVMPNILVKNKKKYSSKTATTPSNTSNSAGYYCYEASEHRKDINESNPKVPKFYLFGRELHVVIPENDLNGGAEYTNSLILVRQSADSVVSQTNAGSTFISKKAIKVTQTHNVCITNIGDQEFKKIRTGDYRIQMKMSGSNEEGWFKVGDFFSTECDNFVQDVFGVVTGGDTASSTPAKTAVSYDKWEKNGGN